MQYSKMGKISTNPYITKDRGIVHKGVDISKLLIRGSSIILSIIVPLAVLWYNTNNILFYIKENRKLQLLHLHVHVLSVMNKISSDKIDLSKN